MPIACAGVGVYPGDVIFGDQEGVVVIPRHLADEIAKDAAGQERFEQFVTEKVWEGRSIFGIYPPNEAAKPWVSVEGRNPSRAIWANVSDISPER